MQTLGSIGDLFPDKHIRCRVRGCNNSWQMAGEEALRKMASADPELPERMCADCFELYNRLADQEVPCAKKGCRKSWRWSRFQQLEARVKGQAEPPRRFCADCNSELQQIAERQLPCRMRGCDQTWVWTRQQQLAWEQDTPPTRLCKRCFEKLRSFEDRQLPCRVPGCSQTWPWSAYQQLEYELAGKDPANPPRRLCRACAEQLKTLHDQDMPCKIKECSRTWKWSTFAQLEHRLAQGEEAPPPDRLCQECYDFFVRAQDVERPCRMKGCRHTWIYGKGWQLRDWLKGRSHAPAMLCGDCRDQLKRLAPIAEPCSVSGCANSWIYAPEEQLKDKLARRREPRAKQCQECEAFLAAHGFENLTCGKCGCEIPWSPYEQLMVAKGTFVKPSQCAACAGKDLPATVAPGPLPGEHHHVVRMPKGGRWATDPEIADWPPHLDCEAIARAEQADLVIVALGDDLTYSAAKVEESWPHLLERRLNEKLADEGLTVAVVNAGMPGTTSRQALVRLKRDVLPFKPDLVLLSFAAGDSLLALSGDSWSEKIAGGEAERAMDELIRQLLANAAKVIYWTTNPMLPHDRQSPTPPAAWANAQEARKAQTLAHALRVCANHQVPVLELRARFEVNGKSSARKWMADWLNHNAAGAQNIATWMAVELLNGPLADAAGGAWRRTDRH